MVFKAEGTTEGTRKIMIDERIPCGRSKKDLVIFELL